jgi:hypothetical protein
MFAVPAFLTFTARGVAQEHIDPMAATVAQSFTMIERVYLRMNGIVPPASQAARSR